MRAPSHVPAIVRGWPLLVVVVVAAGYAHTLGYPYHFDDSSNLRDLNALGPPPDLSAIYYVTVPNAPNPLSTSPTTTQPYSLVAQSTITGTLSVRVSLACWQL